MSDPVFVVLDYEKVLAQERSFAADYKYPISDAMQELITLIEKRKALNKIQ
jgi:hypothetical protein